MKKIILSVILLSLLGCTKSNSNLAMLAPGTKCTLVSGIFSSKDYQPTPPLVIDDIFQDDGGLTIYDATDSKGIVWQIPGNDLVVIK